VVRKRDKQDEEETGYEHESYLQPNCQLGPLIKRVFEGERVPERIEFRSEVAPFDTCEKIRCERGDGFVYGSPDRLRRGKLTVLFFLVPTNTNRGPSEVDPTETLEQTEHREVGRPADDSVLCEPGSSYPEEVRYSGKSIRPRSVGHPALQNSPYSSDNLKPKLRAVFRSDKMKRRGGINDYSVPGIEPVTRRTQKGPK
jgi:hypothetical protein